MREGGRVLRQALALGAIAVLVAGVVHFSLLRRFAKGEFKDSFVQAAEYPGIRLITVEEAEELWRAAGAVFFDARREPDFERGHVPAARSLPAAAAEKKLPPTVLDLSRDGPVVVYCEGGDCQSSLLLARRLHDRGFRDIRVLTGGWADWTRAGLPVESGLPERRDDQE